LYATTCFSVLGGLSILLFVPNGPYRKTGQKIQLNAFLHGFKKQNFWSVSFGYFGHMWELYSFWAFVPLMLLAYNKKYPEMNLNVPLYAFFIIASGGIACVFSGLLSQIYGVQKIAKLSLLLSCCCCLISPLFLYANSLLLFVGFLFFWGMVVIADSPLFSTLVAQNAPEESRGTSLTIVNCIGFSITVISIQLINLVSDSINAQFIYMILAIGPLLGLIGLRNKRKWH
jgi:MFS family permease